ncbi:SDR family NAD(P)-dependent oxidoreductase [Spiroplasma endosymbiont of Crioceris asparagi]|uniref:SDR family NAD(P)-dependent oxidoreductase n=1 Tax=Spiroplasma endosymbiont of Crioceris asparagi TaxID=3066286 RepID=UPI0030D06ADB
MIQAQENMINEKGWAIVTGASKGLGFAYCKELLKKGFNVVGVARNTDTLDELKTINPNVEIKKINLDLSSNESAMKLFELTKDLNITLVINNAGYGVLGKFTETDLEKELNMINLNINCLHIISKLFIQKFQINNKGRIINIGSIASFIPGPGFSSYYASKAYVLNLGVAINTELKKSKSKVRLVTVCPVLLKTDFLLRITDGKKKANYSKFNSIDTNVFAKKSLNKAFKTNKNYIIIGKINKLVTLSFKLLPQKYFLNKIYKFQTKRKK